MALESHHWFTLQIFTKHIQGEKIIVAPAVFSNGRKLFEMKDNSGNVLDEKMLGTCIFYIIANNLWESEIRTSVPEEHFNDQILSKAWTYFTNKETARLMNLTATVGFYRDL